MTGVRTWLAHSRGGMPLHVAESGNPDSPALLFIHGAGLSHALFRRQLESPRLRHYRRVALDLRGHGASGKPWRESAYTCSRSWADDLAAVISSGRLQRPVLVAWSYGAYVAMDYVRARGCTDIAGLVLIGSDGGLLPPGADPERERQMAAVREASRHAPEEIGERMAWGRAFTSRLTYAPLDPDLAEVAFVSTLMVAPYTRRAIATRLLRNDDLARRLNTPVLFVIGARDRTLGQASVHRLLSSLDDACVRVYPRTGHMPFAEKPATFDRDLALFAERAWTRTIGPSRAGRGERSRTPRPSAARLQHTPRPSEVE